jgi:hypothetical protein
MPEKSIIASIFSPFLKETANRNAQGHTKKRFIPSQMFDAMVSVKPAKGLRR